MNYFSGELMKLGLSGLEAKVYLELLQRTLIPAGALAKALKMKRSTVYTILDSLIEKGLVSMTARESVKHYQAESPARFRELLEKKRAELDQQEQLLASMAKDLMVLHDKKIAPPKVTIYEGQKGLETLLMKNLDDTPKEVLVIGEANEGKDRREDHILAYTEKRIKMKIPTRVLVGRNNFSLALKAEDKASSRQTHLLPAKYQFPASMHIYDKSVALFTYQGKDPMGVYIENGDIADTMRMVFELIDSQRIT